MSRRPLDSRAVLSPGPLLRATLVLRETAPHVSCFRLFRFRFDFPPANHTQDAQVVHGARARRVRRAAALRRLAGDGAGRGQRRADARGPRGRADAEAERQVQRRGRVQLRHAQAGRVHEQADAEEHRGDRRHVRDRQEGRRRAAGGGRGAAAGGGPRRVAPRRVRGVRPDHGREDVPVRAHAVAEDPSAARGRLRRVRVSGAGRLARLRRVVQIRKALGIRPRQEQEHGAHDGGHDDEDGHAQGDGVQGARAARRQGAVRQQARVPVGRPHRAEEAVQPAEARHVRGGGPSAPRAARRRLVRLGRMGPVVVGGSAQHGVLRPSRAVDARSAGRSGDRTNHRTMNPSPTPAAAAVHIHSLGRYKWTSGAPQPVSYSPYIYIR